FVNETFDEFFAVGLDKSYLPRLYVLQNLPAKSEWFDDKRTEAVETRDDIALRALKLAIEEIKKNNYKVYGDINKLAMKHPFSRVVGYFDYPSKAMDGDEFTVFNFRRIGEMGYQVGSSWRMIVTFEKDYCVIPGGNSGNFFSKNYDDQLILWAEGKYKVCDFSARGERIVFG
ncbi:MAG: penicillin acylase family protein, partial [Archaeoglobaceae archaeon]